jgi:hypothetical protein
LLAISRPARTKILAPPSSARSATGLCSSKADHASSSPANSAPLIPRGRSSAAAACKRGSAGTLPWSSSSRRSRHQASLIAPSAGWVERTTTSAIASSMSKSASNAGRSSTGQ